MMKKGIKNDHDTQDVSDESDNLETVSKPDYSLSCVFNYHRDCLCSRGGIDRCWYKDPGVLCSREGMGKDSKE